MIEIKKGTKVYEQLEIDITRGDKALDETNFRDLKTGGPDYERIEELVKPYIGEHFAKIPDDLRKVISNGRSSGIAHKVLENEELASAWFSVGQYGWRAKEHFPDYANINPLEITYGARYAPANAQVASAQCAIMINDIPKAIDLFTWASNNLQLRQEEYQEFLDTKQYQAIWQETGFRLYAMIFLEAWEDILAVGPEAQMLVEKDRKRGGPMHFREPQLLLDIAVALARYFTGKSEETKSAAMRAINYKKIPDRITTTRYWMLVDLLPLHKMYPQLT